MDIDTATEIVVPLSKGKGVLHLLGAVAFVAAGIWIWSIADVQTRYHPQRMKAAAVVGISFFGLCALYGLFKFFDTRPGLIIDDQGIVDNSSAVAAGRILWDEVVALNVGETAGQRFITIMVKDPEKFVARGGFFSKMLRVANANMTGSPINISATSLGLRFEELCQILTAALEKHKAAGRKQK